MEKLFIDQWKIDELWKLLSIIDRGKTYKFQLFDNNYKPVNKEEKKEIEMVRTLWFFYNIEISSKRWEENDKKFMSWDVLPQSVV